MTLAVIPARGGSKRIPRKNIKPFCDKPMIGYAIEAAINSELFENVIVSTDDEEIKEIAVQFGAKVPFMRPAELSDDFAPTVPVIAHAIQHCDSLGFSIDEVCCIYPSVPFISISDLKIALDRLRVGDVEFVFPVAQYPSPIQRALMKNADATIQPFFRENVSKRTQDLEPSYFDVGQFYWGKGKSWQAELNLHLHSAAIEIPEWRAIDIDTLADWDRAEILFSAISERIQS